MATKIAATKPKVVSHDKWLSARRAFLKKEKEFTTWGLKNAKKKTAQYEA